MTGPSLFDGDGDMRAQCRAFDWAASPLGPVSAWSQSLRTTVSTLLASRQPMFLFWGPELIQVYNDAYRPSLGQGGRAEHALGMRGKEFWTDIWDTIGPQIAQVMGGGPATWFEDQYLPIARNGRIEEVYWTYCYGPVRDDDDSVGGTLVVCQETTNRVVADRNLQRARADAVGAAVHLEARSVEAEAAAHALAESEARFRTVQDASPDASLLLRSMHDNSGRITDFEFTYANDAVQRILIGDGENVVGRTMRDAFPESVAAGRLNRYIQVVETGEPWLEDVHYRRGRVAHGLRVSAVKVDDGVHLAATDLTERIQAAEERERLLAEARTERAGAEKARVEAENANRAKSEFLAVMSHELRTPLNAIGGYAELIELGIHGPVTPEQRQALERIQSSQRHLLGLITAVLNYARVEGGVLTYAREEVPLVETITECEALTAPQMRAKRITFSFTSRDAPFIACADGEKVRQILLNLLGNAVKFTDPDGRITVHCVAEDGVVAVEVEDTGVGIAPEHLARVLLPGVSARNDYTAALNVRGGESDQNLILLDGYPIYNPFHLGGLFSTFIAPTVGEVTLLAGGFPSPYGGRLSSVLDVHSADESRTGVHGTADVSLLSSSVSLSGARDDGRGSWMIAGRRTYLDAIVDIVKPGGVPYHFSDLQGRLTRMLPGGVQFSTTAYAGLDLLHTASSTYDESRFAWGNEVLGATLTKTVADNPSVAGIPLGARVALEQRVSTSRFHTGLATNISSIAIHSDVNDLRAAGSATSYTARHDRTVGYEVAGIRTTYASNAALPGLQFDSVRQRSRVASGYYDDLWRVSPSLLLQVGARIDAVQAAGASMSPRLSAKYFLTPNLALTAATGRYVQAVHSVGREDIPIRALDFWIASDSALPVSTAWHYTVGLERRITPLRTLRVETFYRTFDHLLDANLLADPGVPGDEFVVSRGRSYGVDVLLQQFEYKRFSGWLSYTYALSSRVDAEGRHFFPGQDRRHDFNAVASWRGERYAFAARFALATGTPYTNVLGDFSRRRYDPLTQAFTEGSTNDKEYLTGARNGERLPLTHRLDVSLLRVPRPGRVSVSPYLSIVNAYYARNTIAYLFNYAPSPPVRTPIPGFPIVPSVGVNIAW